MAVKGNTHSVAEQTKKPMAGGKYGQTSRRESYQEWLLSQLPSHSSIGFLYSKEGAGNLEYIVAPEDGDLSLGLGLPLSTSGEERAYRLLKDWMPKLMPGFDESNIRLFFKHNLQSLMGTHWILGLELKGFEIEEHSFVVHLDRQNRIVMVCCTYLPNLPELLNRAEDNSFPNDENIKKAVDAEKKNLGEYDQVDAENLWLLIWNQKALMYEAVRGSQVKVSLTRRKTETEKPADVLGVIDNRVVKKIHNSPGLADRKLGLCEVIREFWEEDDQPINFLDDGGRGAPKSQGMLLDLESTSELVGRYAAIKDQIAVYQRERNGIFLGEEGSYFDRVNAYYHIDYIQRYFRQKLGLNLLDQYPHLNPMRIVLAKHSTDVARYEVNSQQITFYQLGRKPFTAVRDARVVYHEFVHVVADAIARLHRAGHQVTPRAGEALQAQAMDEGMADYFACSLAAQQGAKKALFYYRNDRKWVLRRNLNPDPAQAATQEQIDTRQLRSDASWNQKKYHLAQSWGRYLWQLRYALGAELADMLIIHSLFFLTRWATFAQGRDAIRLADRLLFGSRHEENVILPQYQKIMSGIKFGNVPFPAISRSDTATAV